MTTHQQSDATSVRMRRRSGISLIEIVVACTLLAMTLTVLTGLATKQAQRQHNISYSEQRVATLYAEVNRVQSMMYDSLTKYLVKDSVQSGSAWYVWEYTIDPDSTSATGTSTYRKVRLTVTPRVPNVNPQSTVIRRMKPPTYNALLVP